MPQSVVRVRCAEMKILKSGRDIGACLTGLEGAHAQSPRGYTNKMKHSVLQLIFFTIRRNYTGLFHFFSEIQDSKRLAV